MLSAKGILFVLLGIFALVYLVGWVSMARKRTDKADAKPSPLESGDRLRHQLLRHARHRLVRDDDALFRPFRDGATTA